MTDKKPDLKWPRYALALVLLFLVAALVWVAMEAYKVKQESNFNAPMQGR